MDDDTRLQQSGIDPYMLWLLGEGRNYYFLPGRQHEWIPLFLLLSDEFTAQEFEHGAHITAAQKRVAWRRAIQVPSLYTDSPLVAGKGAYITASVNVDYLLKDFVEDEELRADLRRAIRTLTPGLPLDASSLPSTDDTRPPKGERQREAAMARAAAPPAPGNTVIMGIIDDGIAFGHERFRKIVGGNIESRIANWWLQDGPFNPSYSPFTDPVPPPPPNVPFGCELSGSQITGLLQSCAIDGNVEEDLVYRKAHLLDFQQVGHKSAAWRIAHGTHVMDLACGYDPDPPRHDRPIIAVQLPVQTTADTSGASLFQYAFAAMWYILVRASQIPGAENAPVVINLSYGRFEGPHDGTADLELGIKFLVALTGGRLRVVLPAGNSFLSRTHAQVTFDGDHDPKRLNWRVLPDDQTPSFFEIWLPKRDFSTQISRLAVTITSPIGEAHTIHEFDPAVTWGAVQSYAELRFYYSLVTGRTMFRLSGRPTTDLTPGAPRAPAGIWKVELQQEHEGLAGQTVHAWVQRDDTLYGFPPRGRQSYFDDENYVRFEHTGREEESDTTVFPPTPPSPVKRESTLNAIATGADPSVAGGYLRKEVVPAKYSSEGANAPPPRHPSVVLVSEDSRVHAGMLAAGSRSGSVVAMGGTSVAAPQYARVIADGLAGFPVPPVIAMPGTLPERTGAGRLTTDPIVKLRRYE
jgi:hypothetical protein